MRVAGVDEAGKGPVLGSMFVAGLMVEDAALPELERLGVRDSKQLSPARRERLAAELERLGTLHVVEVTAAQIDELRRAMTMNVLLVGCYAEVLRALRPDRAYLDAADVKPERFASSVLAAARRLASAEPMPPALASAEPAPPMPDPLATEVVAEHHADSRYPIVSAASIVAKVRRDRSIAALAQELGAEIGSGYPSDPVTVAHLRRLKPPLPPYVRRSWKTVGRVRTLDEWSGAPLGAR